MLLISVCRKTRYREADNFGPATGVLDCWWNPAPLKSKPRGNKPGGLGGGVDDEKGVSLKGIFPHADQTFVQGIAVTPLLDLTCLTSKNVYC